MYWILWVSGKIRSFGSSRNYVECLAKSLQRTFWGIYPPAPFPTDWRLLLGMLTPQLFQSVHGLSGLLCYGDEPWSRKARGGYSTCWGWNAYKGHGAVRYRSAETAYGGEVGQITETISSRAQWATCSAAIDTKLKLALLCCGFSSEQNECLRMDMWSKLVNHRPSLGLSSLWWRQEQFTTTQTLSEAI